MLDLRAVFLCPFLWFSKVGHCHLNACLWFHHLVFYLMTIEWNDCQCFLCRLTHTRLSTIKWIWISTFSRTKITEIPILQVVSPSSANIPRFLWFIFLSGLHGSYILDEISSLNFFFLVTREWATRPYNLYLLQQIYKDQHKGVVKAIFLFTALKLFFCYSYSIPNTLVPSKTLQWVAHLFYKQSLFKGTIWVLLKMHKCINVIAINFIMTSDHQLQYNCSITVTSASNTLKYISTKKLETLCLLNT